MKKRKKRSVRVLLTILAAGSLILCTSAASLTQTPNLKLGLADPLVPETVNANFIAVDEELAARAVTPDMFRQAGDPDDTNAVQAAFDSGKTVIFTRNYGVTSVNISGDSQMINFNGYWLGANAEEEEEALLHITGSNLNLYNIMLMGTGVNMDAEHTWSTVPVNTNYQCGVKWYSEDADQPSTHNTIHNLTVCRFVTGVVYGAASDAEAPAEAAMTGNTVFGYNTRSVQKALDSNQPGGTLHIVGGTLDCNIYEWAVHANTLPDPDAFINQFYEGSYVFSNKNTRLTLDNVELLKTQTDKGYGFKGSDFHISNSCLEIGGVWGYIEGDASLDQTDGGYQGGDPIGNPRSLFVIAPGAEGRLIVQKLLSHRYSGASMATQSSATILGGLEGAPEYDVLLENCKFMEWSTGKIVPQAQRSQVKVKNCYFTDGDAHTVVDDGNTGSSAGGAKQNLLVGLDTTGENMSAAQDMSTKSEWYRMWANSESGYFCKNTEDTPSGFQSAIEYTMNEGMGYISSPMFEVMPGTQVVFSAWVKCSAGAGVNTYVDILHYTEKTKTPLDANFIGQSVMVPRTDFTEGEWKKVTVAYTVPSNAKAAIIRLLADTGSCYITGIELTYNDAPQNPNFNNSFINTLNKALDEPGRGIIFTAPDGKRYMMTVGDDGALKSTPLD